KRSRRSQRCRTFWLNSLSVLEFNALRVRSRETSRGDTRLTPTGGPQAASRMVTPADRTPHSARPAARVIGVPVLTSRQPPASGDALRSGKKWDLRPWHRSSSAGRGGGRSDMAVSGDAVAGTARTSRGWAIAAGILLIVVGMEALAAPYLAALFAAFWIAWGLIFGGIAELISAYSSSETRLWKILLGILYIVVGFYVLRSPGSGLVAIALTLAWLFLIKGVISIFGALQLRPLRGWGWWLFDGIVTLLLAFLIFSGFPQDSVRIIALLVGISLIMSGANRVAWAISHCRDTAAR